jgi:hypothetical protein
VARKLRNTGVFGRVDGLRSANAVGIGGDQVGFGQHERVCCPMVRRPFERTKGSSHAQQTSQFAGQSLTLG